MGKAMNNATPDAVKSAALARLIHQSFNLTGPVTDLTGILCSFVKMEKPAGDISARNLNWDTFQKNIIPNLNLITPCKPEDKMAKHTYLNDDAWVAIIQLQQTYNNLIMTMRNELTECFPYTGQDEGKELDRCFQVIYEIMQKRRNRHEELLDMAIQELPESDRLVREPGTEYGKSSAVVVPIE